MKLRVLFLLALGLSSVLCAEEKKALDPWRPPTISGGLNHLFGLPPIDAPGAVPPKAKDAVRPLAPTKATPTPTPVPAPVKAKADEDGPAFRQLAEYFHKHAKAADPALLTKTQSWGGVCTDPAAADGLSYDMLHLYKEKNKLVHLPNDALYLARQPLAADPAKLGAAEAEKLRENPETKKTRVGKADDTKDGTIFRTKLASGATLTYAVKSLQLPDQKNGGKTKVDTLHMSVTETSAWGFVTSRKHCYYWQPLTAPAVPTVEALQKRALSLDNVNKERVRLQADIAADPEFSALARAYVASLSGIPVEHVAIGGNDHAIYTVLQFVLYDRRTSPPRVVGSMTISASGVRWSPASP